MRIPLVLISLLSLLTGGPGLAKAQDIVCPRPSPDPEYNKNEARSYYNMGNTFFTMKQYEKSAASFVCVLNLVPYSIMARYRLAKSYDHLGRYGLAREQYRWILADASDEASVLKPEVEKRVAELQNLPDQDAPSKEDPPPEPGPPKELPEPGPGTSKPPTTTGTPPSTGTPPPPAAGGLTSRWWFWTGVGATTVFTVAALVSGLQALDYRDRWESDWRAADREALQDWRLATDLALGAAVISAAALGVAVWLHRDPDPTRDPAATAPRTWLLPACGPHGCGLTLSWEF